MYQRYFKNKFNQNTLTRGLIDIRNKELHLETGVVVAPATFSVEHKPITQDEYNTIAMQNLKAAKSVPRNFN